MPNTLFIPDECIPDDHSRQSTCFDVVERILSERQVESVLDLGCGAGNSVDFFRRRAPQARWIGVDIADSAEVRDRRRRDAEFRTFDGIHIPADDASIDLVFCKQVMMNVREPQKLLPHVRRILKPGGMFIGSTAQLEPVVSNSYWNFTPPGFRALLADAGLRLIEMRPGIDAPTLILRRLLWIPWLFDRFWETESPLNRLLDFAGRIRGRSARAINIRKLLVAGHFTFLATPDRTTIPA